MNAHEKRERLLYRDVDREQLDVQEVLAWFLDYQNTWPAIQRCKQAMLDYLQPATGNVALDAGCGLGEDTRILAAHIGSEGRAIGIDASETMIALARERAAGVAGNTDFEVADINALPFAEGTFDLVRCERTFQWLAEPEPVFAELVRVTKPGGRIAVVDSDWASAIWDLGDPTLSRKLLDAQRAGLPNSEAGRQLPALFRRAGMTDIHVEVHVELIDAPVVETLQEHGMDFLSRPLLTDAEWEQFTTARESAIRTGTAFNTNVLFMVGGMKRGA